MLEKIEITYIIFVNMSEYIVSYIYASSKSNLVTIGDENVTQALMNVLNNHLESGKALGMFVCVIKASDKSEPFDSDKRKELVSQFGPISVEIARMFAEIRPVVEKIMVKRTVVPESLMLFVNCFTDVLDVVENHFNNMVSKENLAHSELAKLIRNVQSLSSYIDGRIVYNECSAKISLAIAELDKLGISDWKEKLAQYIQSNYTDIDLRDYCDGCAEIILMNYILDTFVNFTFESRDEFDVDQDLCNDVINAIWELPEVLCL